MKSLIRNIVAVAASALSGYEAMGTIGNSPFFRLDDTLRTPTVFFPATVSDATTQQWEFGFSPDGKTLFYATDKPRRIVVQRWIGSRWSEPAALMPQLESDHGGVSVAPDGRNLFFSWSRDGRPRDLYQLQLGRSDAKPMQLTDTPLTGEISLSSDRTGRGFLWTDRKLNGGGGLGFFRTRLQSTGVFVEGPADEVGSGANSPFVDPGGRFVLFARYGTSKTKEDLFLSELRDGVPLAPVPLGDVVNGDFNDTSPQLSPDGRFLLFSSDRPAGSGAPGDYQIWHMPMAAIPVLKAALALQTNETNPLATPHAGPIVTSSKLRKQDGIQVLAETGKPFTGIVEDRHANNKLKARRSLVDGRVQGVWLEWYDTGAISYYSEWRDSLGDGTWIYFHPNGEVMERAQVVADRWNGIAEGWKPDGSKNYETLFRQGVRTSQKNFGGKETAVVD